MTTHDELLEAMRTKLKATRIIFYSEIATVLEETFLYSIRLADHIGEISYTEALKAVKADFNERMDAIMAGEQNTLEKDKIKEDQ